jgi:hypothetical protein
MPMDTIALIYRDLEGEVRIIDIDRDGKTTLFVSKYEQNLPTPKLHEVVIAFHVGEVPNIYRDNLSEYQQIGRLFPREEGETAIDTVERVLSDLPAFREFVVDEYFSREVPK